MVVFWGLQTEKYPGVPFVFITLLTQTVNKKGVVNGHQEGPKEEWRRKAYAFPILEVGNAETKTADVPVPSNAKRIKRRDMKI